MFLSCLDACVRRQKDATFWLNYLKENNHFDVLDARVILNWNHLASCGVVLFPVMLSDTNSSEQYNELPGGRKSGEYKVSGPGNGFSRKRGSGTREQIELHLYGRLQFVSENSKLNYSQVQI
jgi:hypothetical protein